MKRRMAKRRQNEFLERNFLKSRHRLKHDNSKNDQPIVLLLSISVHGSANKHVDRVQEEMYSQEFPKQMI
jgi:hypothetical protein